MTGNKRWKKVMAFILAMLLMIQVTEDYTLVIRAENEIDNQNETVSPDPMEESTEKPTGNHTPCASRERVAPSDNRERLVGDGSLAGIVRFALC